MDKKFEDKLAKMAFGELSEAEAKEVRAHAAANADAAKMLASYEALRSDLRRMKDVPPDQLSKERLQNAILTQGLKPKPVRRAFPWAWTSSVAVMSALAIMLFLRLPQDAPRTGETVAMNDAPAPVLGPDDSQYLGRSFNGFGDQFGFSRTTPAAIESTEAPVAPRDGEIKAPVASSPRLSVVRYASAGRTYKKLTDRSNRPTLNVDDVKMIPVSMIAPTAKKTPETLVLIKSEKDDSTGASSAVEVRQTQDVIVSS